MSTELTIVQPATGETLDLSRDTEDLARWIDEAREMERQLKEIRERIGEELVSRMDRQAKWTIHANGFKVTAPSPAPKVEWDADKVLDVLNALVADGAVGVEAAAAAIEQVVAYKPKVAGLNALLKLGGVVAERLSECRAEVENARHVRVVRK